MAGLKMTEPSSWFSFRSTLINSTINLLKLNEKKTGKLDISHVQSKFGKLHEYVKGHSHSCPQQNKETKKEKKDTE